MKFYKITIIENIEIDGKRLRKKRESLNLSATKLARLCGISTVFLCSIELGKGKSSYKTARRIISEIDKFEARERSERR